MRAEMDRRAMAALSSGHAAVDFAGGALPALLPFLADRFSLSYTLTAVLMLASALASSVIQPLFGLWSDRRGALWLLPAGVAVGGIGMAIAAAAPSYWLIVLFVVVSGLGTAAYHPEGSKFAAFASGRKRASGMSLFSVGGNLGYGIGAAVTTPIVLALGLRGGLLIAVPGVLVALYLLSVKRELQRLHPEREEVQRVAGRDQPRALALLLVVIAFRSFAWFGLITFVPLWEVSQGHSKAYGNHLLTLMLLVGGVGTILCGLAADRYGRRAVLLASSLVTGPLIVLFVAVGGVPGAIALAIIGPMVIGTFGVTMVMSQEYLPRNIGLASGLSVGFSIGLGGLATVVLGFIADSIDLRTALYVCACAPVIAFVLTLPLPSTTGSRALAPEVVVP